MPRVVASGIVLLCLAVAIGVSLYLAVRGLIDQAPEIGRRLASGFDELSARLGHHDVHAATGEQIVHGFGGLWSTVRRGLAGNLGSVFSSTAAFLAGMFVATILLFFILHDWPRLSAWVAAHLGVSETTGADIVVDATWSLRQYFMALTISSLIVAAIVGTTAVILAVPLVVAITVVTFFTSYIPYIGALFSGTFAVLIALGSGGASDAVIILVVVLVAQNVVQTVVQTKLSKDRLALHPIVIFGSTIAGGATFGLLGAALSTPVTALLIRINTRLTAIRIEEAESAEESDSAA
jgi:predicted PurR-regulated permease PerM